MNMWTNHSQNANLHDADAVYCPKCNKHLPIEMNYSALNDHLEMCGFIEDSTMLIQSYGQTPATQVSTSTQITSTFLQANTKGKEPFIWIKKQNKTNSYVWEKQKVSQGIGEDFLAELGVYEVGTLDFEDKRKWFRNGLELLRIPWTEGSDLLQVERSKLLESSMKAINKCLLYKEVKIEFVGDEKVNDAGGLMREWMTLAVKELMSQNLGLFITTDSDEVSYTINHKLPNTQAVLDMYEFAGKIIGKAIFERITLNAHFDDCTLRAITGRDVILEDLKTLDTQLYNSLVYIQKTTLGGCEMFQEYFVVTEGGDKVIELCEHGANMLVTDQNKDRYIQLIVDWYGRKRIQNKIKALVSGVASCIPIETLWIFEPQELEMIINGVPFIDVDDWEANTIYRGCYTTDHKVISWFWKALRGMSQKELSQLLQYCTGSTRTPVEGFRALESNRGESARFCIESCDYIKGLTLITAQTCFNRLVLPIYPDEETLKKELYNIIHSDFEGVFGLA